MENNERYYVIHCFFSEELNLSGIDKEVFALIYGFTRDGRNANGFWGTIDYMAKYIGVNEKSISRSLKYLTEQKLINKYSIRAESKFFRYAYEANLNTVFEKRKQFKEAKKGLTDNLSPSVDDILTDKMSFTIEGLTDNLSPKEGVANGQNVPLYYKENNNIDNNSIIDCEKQFFSPPLSSFSKKETKNEAPSVATEKTTSLNTKKTRSISTRPDACLNTEKKPTKEKKYADKYGVQKDFMEMYCNCHLEFKKTKPLQRDMGMYSKRLNELRLAIEEVVEDKYLELGKEVNASIIKEKLQGYLRASYEHPQIDHFTKTAWDANYISLKFANIYAILIGATPKKPPYTSQQKQPQTFSEIQDSQFKKDFLVAILKSVSMYDNKKLGLINGCDTVVSLMYSIQQPNFIPDEALFNIIKERILSQNLKLDTNNDFVAKFCEKYSIDKAKFNVGL